MNIFQACIQDHKREGLIKSFVLVILALLVMPAYAESQANAHKVTHYYGVNLEHAKWSTIALPQESDEKLECGLMYDIPSYGTVTFRSYAGQSIELMLHSARAPIAASYFNVTAENPEWKHPHKRELLFKTTFPALKDVSITHDKNVWLVLNTIERGGVVVFDYEVKQYKSIQRVNVELSPINFQKAFQEFITCKEALLDFGYDTIKVSVINFDYESFKLNEQAKRMLWRIKRYYEIDPSIKMVTIEGHSDGLGSDNFNRYVSEKRALVVRKFILEELGLPKNKVRFKAVGSKQPVASNNTDYGRAMNRRAVVTLYREDKQVIGAKPLRKQL